MNILAEKDTKITGIKKIRTFYQTLTGEAETTLCGIILEPTYL